MAYNTGEKPGKGSYCCTNCGWRVTLDDHDGGDGAAQRHSPSESSLGLFPYARARFAL